MENKLIIKKKWGLTRLIRKSSAFGSEGLLTILN